LKALETVLREKPPERYTEFDDLFEAYKKKVSFFADMLAKRHVYEYEVERENSAFLLQSALFGDCLEKGVSMVNGGAKYLGGICESFGNTNTGDSLAAIKKLVYDEKKFTLKQLVEILDADFDGYELERKMMLDVPKYGNDDEETDELVAQVNAHIGKACIDAGKKNGLHHFLVVNINNEGNITFGYVTKASADGRKTREPLANGNAPTAGKDIKGPTAFLNSIVKIDPSLHAGYVHNMKFSKEMFTAKRALTETLLFTYFKKGGTQAMITVLNRGDLEKAMQEPEKYKNLIVRVGGFSARFVTLNRDLQVDILKRTHYY
jgi:pyruvate-formate lyase